MINNNEHDKKLNYVQSSPLKYTVNYTCSAFFTKLMDNRHFAFLNI